MSEIVKDAEISKFMSFVLRHAPHEAGLQLDESGWVDFADLEKAITEKFSVDTERILQVIHENPKKRFTLNDGRIRAAQGHSVDISLNLEPIEPPALLFHGTNMSVWDDIKINGIKSMQRKHVHLSASTQEAQIVAKRRTGPHIILQVDAKSMHEDGHKFILSENQVWLTPSVPSNYLSLKEQQ